MAFDLSDQDQKLIAAAIAARAQAYCPYSEFAVGCAVRTNDGKVFTGANVENAAYPAGLCAEAAALGTMASAGYRRIAAIAVSGSGDQMCTPCGMCRQRIREFAASDVPVLVCDEKSVRAVFTTGELLPQAFGPEHLGKQTSGN